MNRLCNVRTYLAGPIDFCPNFGKGWRQDLVPFLKEKNIVVIDPTNKPKGGLNETADLGKQLQAWKEAGEFEKLVEYKSVRHWDLRYVDISDFLIVHINTDIFACGTFEEIFSANKQKKPVLIHAEHGLRSLPNWIFWTFPLEHLFEDWEELKNYLTWVDTTSSFIDQTRRWRFIELADQYCAIGEKEKE